MNTPRSERLERALLGAFLLSAEEFYSLRARINPRIFFSQAHRLIYGAMCQLADKGKSPADVLQIVDYLAADGVLDVVGGPSTVTGMASEVPSAVNADEYAAELLRLAALREVQAVLARRLQDTNDPQTDPELLAQKIGTEAAAAVVNDASKYTNAAQALDHLTASFDAGGQAPIEPTGFAAFDRLLGGGIRAGASYFIGGLYKHGKSKLTLCVAVALLQRGYLIDWHSCEMSAEEMAIRAISLLAAVTEDEVQYHVACEAGHTPPVDTAPTFAGAKAIDAALAEWRDIGDRFRVYNSGSPFVGDIYANTQARAMAAKVVGAPCAVFVDYLQECTARLPGVPKTDRHNIAECASKLNAAAKDAGIPIFVVYQLAQYKILNRRKDKSATMLPMPRASDGEGSAKIPQAANEVILIHRPWAELDSNTPNASFCVLRRGAARSGSTRQVYLRAQYALNTFSDWKEKPPAPFDV